MKKQTKKPLSKGSMKRCALAMAFATMSATLGIGLSPVAASQTVRSDTVACSNEWAQQSLDYLKTKLGYVPPFYFCYEINAGETETTYIRIDQADVSMGRNLAFVAECDSDCPDLDLRVYNEAGRLVGDDLSTDSYAEVYVSDISLGQTYQVDITMYDCDASFCGAVLGTTPRR